MERSEVVAAEEGLGFDWQIAIMEIWTGPSL